MHQPDKRALGKVFVLGLLISILFYFTQPVAAIPAQFTWKSNGGESATPTNFGFFEADGVTPLAGGDVVQLVWVGPNGVIDLPDVVTGAPGGDDLLVDVSNIQLDNTLPPPQRGLGYVESSTVSYDTTDPWEGGQVYLRAWNASSAGSSGGATAYGESVETATIMDFGDHNFQTADPGDVATTDKSATPPDIEVRDGVVGIADDTGSVNVGATTTGNPISKVLTVKNTGPDPLNLSTPISVPAGFSATSFGQTTLAQGESTTFTVQLTAGAPGIYAGTLSFANNDPDESPYNFTVEGTVSAPNLVVLDGGTALENNAAGVDFGSTTAGTPVTRIFQVKNIGTANLTLTQPTVTGAGFSLAAQFGNLSLAPQASTTFAVQLNATAVGTFNGMVSFESNDTSKSPFAFNITGQVKQAGTGAASEIELFTGGVNVADDTGSVGFGTTLVGSSVIKNFSVHNTGNANLIISAVAIVGDGFSVSSQPANTTIAPGGSTTFALQFAPMSDGIFSAAVSLDTNDNDENPFNFTVTGAANANAPSEPEIAVQDGTTNIPDNTGSVDLGTTTVGTPLVKTITLKNTAPLTSSNLLISDMTLPPGFTLAGGGELVIVPGGSATFQVQLDATAAGFFSGVLAFTTNDADENPFNFTISGAVNAVETAPEIEVRQAAANIPDNTGYVSFGSTPKGTAVVKTFTVQNSGNAYLHLSGLSVPGGFNIAGNFGSTSLAPGESTTFAVRLPAGTAGLFSGEVSFTTNDGDETPFNFAISGAVLTTADAQPEIQVLVGASNVSDDTGTVDFGTTSAGTPVSKTFTVKNTGTAALNLAGLSVPAGFSVVETFGQTAVAPNGSTTFAVQFDAALAGTVSGSLAFANNDGDENPFDFTVQGTVSSPTTPDIEVKEGGTAIADNSGSVNFGTRAVGANAVKTFTITNVGTANLTLANLSIPAGFKLAAPLGRANVAPNASTTFQVALDTSTAGLFSGEVHFTTNDADESPFNFTITGGVVASGAAPNVRVSNDGNNVAGGGTLDLGSFTVDEIATLTFVVENTGNGPLYLSNLTVSDELVIVSDFAGTAVAQNGTTQFKVQVAENVAGDFAGTVQFNANDPQDNPFTFTIGGTLQQDVSLYLPMIVH